MIRGAALESVTEPSIKCHENVKTRPNPRIAEYKITLTEFNQDDNLFQIKNSIIWIINDAVKNLKLYVASAQVALLAGI